MTDVVLPIFKCFGCCPVCDNEVDFVSYGVEFRDYFICPICRSIPRERALMTVIDSYFPAWRGATVHESSPASGGASRRLATECVNYVGSQFFSGQISGSTIDGFRCENLESLSFLDESVDLHVTQDVLEHVFQPSMAFNEIARTLKPGGMHVFTVPLVNRDAPSRRRAIIERGEVKYLLPETYHGNPVGDGRSLVTFDWGFDICRHIFDSCGLFTHVVHIDDLSKGIRAKCIEVLVTVKPLASSAGSVLL